LTDGNDFAQLRELTLTVKRCRPPTSGNTLKMFFSFLPNLESLSLTLNELIDFNEPDFAEYLAENKRSFANLKHLKMVFGRHPAAMTGKTVLAIMKNSNVVNFQEIYKIKFSAEDMKELLKLCDDKKLRIISVFCDAFTCDNGFHGSYFEYQPEDPDEPEFVLPAQAIMMN
jgi:hypothetical protein